MPKPVDELTADEQFAIAFNAGVPIKEINLVDGKFKIVLMPAAISIVDNKYFVAWKKIKCGRF